VTAARTGTRSLAWLPTAALLVGLAVALTPLDEILSRPLTDWQHRRAGPDGPPAGVVVIDIDDASLVALRPDLGAWPFRRDVYALVVEQLREFGAKAIAIDLLFADAHDGDQALARAIARPGAPVILAAAGLRYAQDDAAANELPGAGAGPAGAPAYGWPAMALPTPSVWPAAGQLPRTGVITTPLDEDGRLRSLPLWHAWRGHRLPALPLAVWMALSDEGAPTPGPVDAQGRVDIAFAGAATGAPALSFARVARSALGLEDGSAVAGAVRDRVVFIGSSALLADSVMTVSGQHSGTAILAQSYAALRDGRLLRPQTRWAQSLLLGLALVPSLLTYGRGRASVARDALWAVLALLAVVSLGLALLARAWMPTLWGAPLAAIAVGLALAVLAHQRSLARTHRRLAYERAVADASNRAKSEFLANVSHEIRTPMNALLGVAELLDETPLNAQQRQHVRMFRESGQSLQELINDLLDLSRIEAGRFELDDVPFSLQELLTQQLALQRPRAEQKRLKLELEIAADVPDGVKGDRRRLQQGLTNLVGNAIKFTHSGSVRLSISLGPGPDDVTFAVIDTGIGIVPSKFESIFEPFTQADGSVTRRYGGTGLGLSITRSIAQLMGGRIDVQSIPGQGSTFTLVVPLPAADGWVAEPARAPALAAPAMAQSRSHAILLAEDNEVNVYVFEGMLADQGLRIDVATNGHSALEMARARRYDLIFMDVQMPGMDGLSVTRSLRQFESQTGRVRTPVIALTANAYAKDVQSSLEAGCEMHMAKPFSKTQLVDALLRFVPPDPAAGTAPAPAEGADVPPDPVPPSPAGILDHRSALARHAGDTAQHRRVLDHASVFIERWQQDFDAARARQDGALMRGLARDLRATAVDIGAHALAGAAAKLEDALALSPAAELQARTLAGVQSEIVPVIVAITGTRNR
jgi:signal transduction histidine kinase/ActR/RegA family two-component response regulator